MEEETPEMFTDEPPESLENIDNSILEVLNNSGNSLDLNTSKSEASTVQVSTNQKQKFLKLPLMRIKTIMKLDPDVSIISQDAIFLVAKATEMFIELLAKEACRYVGTGKRKTVLKRDIDIAVETCASLCFLDGTLET